MNEKLLALAALLTWFWTADIAQAQENPSPIEQEPCRLVLQATGAVDWIGPLGKGYEVFSNAESFETVIAEVRHSGRACKYVLTANATGATGLSSLTSGTSRLTFDLLASSNGPSIISPDYFGTQASRIEGEFAAGSSVQAIPLLVAIPAGQYVRSGQYQGQVILRLFAEEVGELSAEVETTLAITTRVASAMEIRSPEFGGTARDTSIDLGDLGGGAERALSFELRSNADVNMSFRSSNNGQLAHEFGGPGIPYALRVRGETINPGIGSSISLTFLEDGQEHEIPLSVQVEAPNGIRAAGKYRDTLTIVFTVP